MSDQTAGGLAPREVEVLLAMAEGITGKEAGHRLGISEQTVKNYLHGAYRKLDVTNLVGAFRSLGWLRITAEEADLRKTEAELLGEVTAVLDVLGGITGRLDAARDALASRRPLGTDGDA